MLVKGDGECEMVMLLNDDSKWQEEKDCTASKLTI